MALVFYSPGFVTTADYQVLSEKGGHAPDQPKPVKAKASVRATASSFGQTADRTLKTNIL